MKKGSNKSFKKKLELILWFLLRFNLLAIPLYLAIYSNFSFLPLQTLFAQMAAGILKEQDYAVQQTDQILTISADNTIYSIDMSWDSTGWKSLYALAALVLAVPASNLKSKLRFLAIGLPAIFILNLFRIVTTILIALNFGFQYFDIVHTVLWREGLIVAVVVLWYVWLKRERIIKYYIR